MRTSTKGEIAIHLVNAQAWLSADDLAGLLSVHRSTAARALRSLRQEGKAQAVRIPGDPRCRRQWARPNSPATLPDAKPTLTVKLNKKANKIASFKSSSPGALTMCAPANKPTFTSAVETVVNDFVGQNKKFSAHDVTKEVRERIKAGTLVVDATETGTRGGNQMPNIEHEEVKDTVHGMFNLGQMANYDRAHNGTFFEYEPAQANTILPGGSDPAASSDPTNAPTSAAGGTYDGTPTL